MDGLGVFQAGDHETDLADPDRFNEGLGRVLYADAIDEEILAALHHAQDIAFFDGTVEHANRCHHAAILIEIRIEDEGLQGSRRIALGRRDEKYDCLE